MDDGVQRLTSELDANARANAGHGGDEMRQELQNVAQALGDRGAGDHVTRWCPQQLSWELGKLLGDDMTSKSTQWGI